MLALTLAHSAHGQDLVRLPGSPRATELRLRGAETIRFMLRDGGSAEVKVYQASPEMPRSLSGLRRAADEREIRSVEYSGGRGERAWIESEAAVRKLFSQDDVTVWEATFDRSMRRQEDRIVLVGVDDGSGERLLSLESAELSLASNAAIVPRVGTVTVTPDEINTSASSHVIHAEVQLLDDGAGVSLAFLTLRHSSGDEVTGFGFLVSGTANDGVWAADMAIPQFSAPGRWELEVLAFDNAGGIHELSTGGGVDVTGTGDSGPPELIGTPTVSPSSIDLSDGPKTITVTGTFRDDLSGVEYVLAEFLKGDEYGFSGSAELVSGDSLEGVWEAEVFVPENTPEGTWTLTFFTGDQSGNFAEISTSRTVTIGGSDVAPPTLVGTPAIDPPSINVSAADGTVSVTASVRDDLSGVSGVDFELELGDEEWLWGTGELIGGDSLDGTWRGMVRVPRNAPEGNYTLTLQLYDVAGNWREVETDLFLEVGGGDGAAPTISGSVTVDRSTVNLSPGPQTITATIPMMDDQSGVMYVYASLAEELDGPAVAWGSASLVSGDSLDGVWEAELTIAQSTPPGQYILVVEAADKADNYEEYATGVTIDVTIDVPGVAVAPDPEDGAVGVVEAPILRWQADNATSYDLYLWPASAARPDTAFAADVTTSSFGFSDPLEFGTSYNWQIISRNAVGEAVGAIWTFTTRELADLQVTAIQLPPDALAGQQIEVQWTVTNAGGAATTAPVWQDFLYLSTDTQLEPRLDQSLGYFSNVSYLNPGESYVNTQQVTLPRRVFGPLYILIRTDGMFREEEANRDNNIGFEALQVILPPAPDLQLVSLDVPEIAFSGEEIPVRWTVENAGDGRVYTNAWDDYIFLSRDSILVPNEELDSQRLRMVQPNLEPDSVYTASSHLVAPDSLSGTLYVFLHVDRFDNEFEPGGEDNNIHRKAIQIILSPPSDLVVTDIEGPTSAGSGERVMLEWSVQNQGSSGTPRVWKDRLYLSPTPAFDPATAHVLGTFSNISSLEPDSSYTMQREVRIPDGISGRHYFVAVADWSEDIFEGPFEDNNDAVGAAGIDVSLSPWPDLQITAIDIDGLRQAGELLTLTWRVENNGSAAAETAWRDSLFLSTSSSWDRATARELGVAHRTSALEEGASGVQTTQVRLPLDITGSYYIYVVADAGLSVYEHTAEGNNVARSNALSISSNPPPDLAVTAVDAPASAGSGRTIDVAFTVSNEGTGRPRTLQWADAVFFSEDDRLDTEGDTQLTWQYRLESLEPGAVYERQLEVEVPNGVEGDYFLIAVADRDLTVTDGNPSNNARAVPITVNRTPPPDLALTALDVPDVLIAGQPITLRWTGENRGEGATPDTLWYDAVFLSRTPSVEGGLRLAMQPIMGGTAADASYEATHEVEIPLYATGRYYVVVVADGPEEVYEEDRANNLIAVPVTVTLPPPSDLVVSTIDIPDDAVVGEVVTISYTIKNQGSNPAQGRLANGIYFSSDPSWDADDPLVAVDEQTIDLAPGETALVMRKVDLSEALTIDQEGEVTGRVPGVVPGSYRVIVRADLRNNIPETDEANNVMASADDVNVDVPVLTVGVPVTAPWDFRNTHFYRVDVGDDVDLRVRLERENSFSGGVYVSRETMPSSSLYEFAAAGLDGARKEIVVPSTTAGRYYVMVRSDHLFFPVEEYTVTAEALSFSVTSVAPQRGGQGVVTTRIQGAGFRPESRVFLRGPSGDVTEAEVLEVPSTVELVARWTLTDVPVGTYSVVVRNGGSAAELANGFEVEPLRPPSLELVKNLPPALLVDRPGTYVLQFRNTSNVDIEFASIMLTVPPTTELSVTTDGRLLTRSMLNAEADGDSTSADYIDSPVARFVPLVARDITVGDKLEVKVTLTPTADPSNEFPLQAVWQLQDREAFLKTQLERIETGRRAVLANEDRADPRLFDLAQDPVGFAEFVLDGYAQLGLLDESDVRAGLDLMVEMGKRGVAFGAFAGAAGKASMALVAGSRCEEFFDRLACPLAIGDCFIDIPFVPLTAGQSMALCAFGVSTACLGIDVGILGCAGVLSAINCLAKELICRDLVFAFDPNDILGPEGYGDRRWVSSTQTLAYRIRFENDAEEATAPAQVVRITLPVDSTLDERSFRLGSFGFGPYTFDVPENAAAYSTRLDLRDSLGIYVDVSAGIDVQTREAFWVLRSIDPQTGTQPVDPFAGFLAVNDSLGSGEGFVSYTLRPNRDAETGEVADAEASIVFDLNSPIATPPIFNTIDAGLPESRIRSFTKSEDQIELSWTASDDAGGSGLRDYALYVSTNNEPFELYRSGLTGSSIVYPREEGQTYRFFVVASDNAGNVEAGNGEAEIVVSTEPAAVELPTEFALGQNYPNPFNPTTIVPFDLSEAGGVEIVLFDVIGRRVARLDLGQMQPGRYKQQLDLSRYASGVYFYELRVTGGSGLNFRDVKQLVLVK